MNTPLKQLSFEQFQDLVAEVLHLQPTQIQPEARFVIDLGVDSIRMAEILLRLEMLGLPLSADLIWRIETVNDAYRYYQDHSQA